MFVSTDARRACSRSVIGSTVGAYPQRYRFESRSGEWAHFSLIPSVSECPGLRPAWPYLFARTARCLGLSSFVSSSSLQLSFLCSCGHRWVPVSFPITCACRDKLSRWVLLLFSSYSSCSVVLRACVKLERLRL